MLDRKGLPTGADLDLCFQPAEWQNRIPSGSGGAAVVSIVKTDACSAPVPTSGLTRVRGLQEAGRRGSVGWVAVEDQPLNVILDVLLDFLEQPQEPVPLVVGKRVEKVLESASADLLQSPKGLLAFLGQGQRLSPRFGCRIDQARVRELLGELGNRTEREAEDFAEGLFGDWRKALNDFEREQLTLRELLVLDPTCFLPLAQDSCL